MRRFSLRLAVAMLTFALGVLVAAVRKISVSAPGYGTSIKCQLRLVPT
jgi:hypothetical protein